MFDFACGLAMRYGHSPEAVREYAWRDLELLVIMAPLLEQQSRGGFFHG